MSGATHDAAAAATRPSIHVIDAEAGGDISRVVVSGVATPPGSSMRARLQWLREGADGLRRLLLYPPHGEPSMSANLIVPAVDPRADAGFIIMEAMGYPFFSGSNAMCTAAVLSDCGLLATGGERSRVVLESPAGPCTLSLERRDGNIASIGYRAPEAFVARAGRSITLPCHGRIRFDVVYGGVFYAVVEAASFGLDPARHSPREFASVGAALVEAARPSLRLRHPAYGPAGQLSFALFVGDVKGRDRQGAFPLAAYVHPGVICHGPSGTGTSALMAWLHARGRLQPGDRLVTVSPEGGRFEGRLLAECRRGERPAVRTEIIGRPRLLADTRILIDEKAAEDRNLGLDRWCLAL